MDIPDLVQRTLGDEEVDRLRDEADDTVSELSDADDFEAIFQEFPGDA